VLAKPELHELLEFENVCQSAKIGVQICLYLQIATIIVCDMRFLKRPSLSGQNLAEHIFVKVPKGDKLF
jgi:hypothetical protein